MKPKIFRHFYLLASAFFLLAIILSGCSIFSQSSPAKNQATSGTPTNPQLEKNYEKQIRAVLAPFWATHNAAGIRDQILEIRTPAKYLDLHLSLVLAFETLEPAQAQGEQNKIDSVLGQLNQLKTQYLWLE